MKRHGQAARSVDFKRVKRKVGRKAAPAANSTRTSFQTRAINMPQQRALEEAQAGEALSSRSLALPDLVKQTRHHNAGVRRDAYLGIRDLVARNEHVLDLEAATVIHAAVQGVGDAERPVREALLLLVGDVFAAAGERTVAPFVRLVVAGARAGVSHMYEGVRRDALRLVELLLEHFPGLVWAHAGDLLPAFLTMLQRKGAESMLVAEEETRGAGKRAARRATAAGGKRSSVRVMLDMLPSLLALCPGDGGERAPARAPSRGLYRPSAGPGCGHAAALRQVLGDPRPAALTALGDPRMVVAAARAEAAFDLAALLHALVPLLERCWLQVAPSLDGGAAAAGEGGRASVGRLPARTLAAMGCLLDNTAAALRVLGRVGEPGSTDRYLAHVVDRVFPFFPWAGDDRAVVGALNMRMCEVVGHFLGGGAAASAPAARGGAREPWVVRLVEFVASVVHPPAVPGTRGRAVPARVDALLPVLEGLLPRLDTESAAWLLDCFTQYYASSPAARVDCLGFVERRLRASPPLMGGFTWFRYEFGRYWLRSLPALAVEAAAAGRPGESARALRLFGYCGRVYGGSARAGDEPTEFDQAAVVDFDAELGPLLETVFAAGGGGGEGEEVPSPPFLALPGPAQEAALEALHHFSSCPPELMKALVGCLRARSAGGGDPLAEDAAVRVLDAVALRTGQVNVPALLSFLLSAVFPPADAPEPHAAVVAHASTLLGSAGLGGAVTRVVDPVVAAQLVPAAGSPPPPGQRARAFQVALAMGVPPPRIAAVLPQALLAAAGAEEAPPAAAWDLAALVPAAVKGMLELATKAGADAAGARAVAALLAAAESREGLREALRSARAELTRVLDALAAARPPVCSDALMSRLLSEARVVAGAGCGGDSGGGSGGEAAQ